MNAPVNQSGGNAEDDVISAMYRRTADECAPDRLNQTILRRARKAGARNAAKPWHIGWLQPLAIVAVVGLSLALILDINELVDAGSPSTTETQGSSETQGSNSLDSAAAAALEQIRAAESLAQQSPGVSDTATPPTMVEQDKVGNFAQVDAPQCSATQRATTALWWQCIQSLERGGHAESATIEYEALFATYPAFEVP